MRDRQARPKQCAQVLLSQPLAPACQRGAVQRQAMLESPLATKEIDNALVDFVRQLNHMPHVKDMIMHRLLQIRLPLVARLFHRSSQGRNQA